MMVNKHLYARQKLREAIYSLATGPDDIRKRLTHAYKGFSRLKETNFPEHLKSDWEWIQNELKKYGPAQREDGSIARGAVENTCNRIKKKTGVKIAERILKVYINLDIIFQ